MKLILILSTIGFLTLSSCNTVVGTAKGVGRDAKAVFIYSRDAVTGRPISD
jgi:predicted small secreted protein